MRIAICQSAIPSYRVPIFEHLGSIPGVELTVYTATGPCHQHAINASHFNVVNKPEYTVPFSGGSLFYRPDFSEAIASGEHDMVILPWNIRYVNLEWAVRLGRRRDVPVVLWGHGYSKRPRELADWQRNRIGRMAAGVLLYTHTVADALVGHSGFDPSRVFVAQNALDQSPIAAARKRWLADPARLAGFQRQHGLDPNNTLIFVSRLLDENRIDMLIEGLRRLHETRPEARLVIVGRGAHEKTLREMVLRLGLQNHVIFTGAIQDDMQLAPWMLSASVFAYATNIGLSLIHAFGYGLPAVTSDAMDEQNPEVEALVDGVNGLLYRRGSVDDMAACWTRLLDDGDLRAQMGQKAMQTVAEKYTAETMINGFVSTLSLVGWPVPAMAPLAFSPAAAGGPDAPRRDRRMQMVGRVVKTGT